MTTHRFLGSLLVTLGMAACGGSNADPGPSGPVTDAGARTDASAPVADAAGAVTDTGPADTGSATQDAATVTATMHNCTSDAWVDQTTGTDNDRMIMTTRSQQFDYPCMMISPGQSVMFMWSFASMPLAPGLAPSHAGDPPGTVPNPIHMHSSGAVYSVRFPTAGMYPFYVPGHDADGLVGVVMVH